MADAPYAALLLPRPLESFILRDLATDLLRAPRVVAVEPARIPHGVVGRLPEAVAFAVGGLQARRLRLPGPLAVAVMFHPLQWPLARALAARPGCALWYSVWDRYDRAYGAEPRMLGRLESWHAAAAGRADRVLAVNAALAALEHGAGRDAEVVRPPHDSFPAPDPGTAVVAASLGHLGRRTDWGLVRALAERMPELVLLLVGELHAGECRGDADLEAVRSLPNVVFLGRLDDEAAARVLLCADAGLLPFRREPFNDAALPQRIVKHARVGRRTLVPPLAGAAEPAEAVVVCDTVDEWAAALRAERGRRADERAGVRAWALAQTAALQDEPLWEGLAAAGVVDLDASAGTDQPSGAAGSSRRGRGAGASGSPSSSA